MEIWVLTYWLAAGRVIELSFKSREACEYRALQLKPKPSECYLTRPDRWRGNLIVQPRG